MERERERERTTKRYRRGYGKRERRMTKRCRRGYGKRERKNDKEVQTRIWRERMTKRDREIHKR